MINRKTLAAVIPFLLTILLAIPTVAFAASSVSVWYSTSSDVQYTPYDGSYYIRSDSTNSTFNQQFRAAVTHAAAQWNSVLPIGVKETSFNYALNYIYGGTRDQLVLHFPSLGTKYAGLTITPPEKVVGTVTYNGATKTVKATKIGSKMCVVEFSGKTANGYKNTATHEMGHLFGWKGHSPVSTDIMFEKESEKTTLTSRDKAHLKQIYNLFY